MSARHSNPNADELPRVRLTRGRLLGLVVFVVSALAFLYFVLPKLLGLNETWNRIEHGNGWWLALAAVLEVCSFLGYIVLFRGVFIKGHSRIDWPESYQITMASLAATRLFAAAGAGGIALTAWALRRSGMRRQTVAIRMIAFTALLYAVYMITLVIDGVGLYLGVIPGPAPFAITIVPAIFGAVVLSLFLGISMLPADVNRVIGPLATARGTVARLALRFSAASATGASGVHGGMIGAFTAFGVNVELSVVAVLAYRAFAFWLPTLPGAVAYLQLRRTVHRWGTETQGSLRGASGGSGQHTVTTDYTL